MKKAVLFVCLVGGMAFAGTNKSFTVTLAEPAMVGETQLQAGDYKFELENEKVVITQHGRQAAEASVKIETENGKYPNTTVTFARPNGTNKMEEIQVGGTHMKLVLN